MLASIAASVLVLASCSATADVTLDSDAVAAATATAGSTAQGSLLPDGEPDAGASEPADSTSGESTAAEDPTDLTPDPGFSEDRFCRYAGVDDFRDMLVEISIVIDGGASGDLRQQYALFDPDGTVLVEGEHILENVQPGERVRLVVDTLTEEPAGIGNNARCELVGPAEPWPTDSTLQGPSDADVCRFGSVDNFDDIQVELEAVNPFADQVELIIEYALRGPEGVRFANGVAFSGAILEPGEAVLLPVDTLSEFPSWADQSSFSCEILAIGRFE